MERFKWLLDEILTQIEAIKDALSAVFAHIPGIGLFASNHTNVILMLIMAVLTVAIIKPLVKWSILIVVGGTVLAVIISYTFSMTFWGVLPLTALGVSIVLFSNKFTMG